MCEDVGAAGHYPLDTTITAETPRATAFAIYQANRALIDACDVVVVELSPFRGPSADPGSVWELGYAVGTGKVVAAWSKDGSDYASRIPGMRMDGRDSKGDMVEDFGLSDNLMLEGCLEHAGTKLHADFSSALTDALQRFQLQRHRGEQPVGRPGRHAILAIHLQLRPSSATQFGEDVAAVRQWVQPQALLVVEDAAAHRVRLIGSPRGLEQALGITLLRVRGGGQPSLGYRGSITLPEDMRMRVTDVDLGARLVGAPELR